MENNLNQANTPSMKWHKFLIYFSLWAGAVLNLLSAVQYFTGSIYGTGNEANMIYAYYDGIKAIDMLMAVLLIVIAVFSVVTRFALAGYKARGPQMLMGLYLINMIAAVFYLVIASVVTGISLGDLVDSSTLSSLISSIAMVFINKSYYGKRAHLFDK